MTSFRVTIPYAAILPQAMLPAAVKRFRHVPATRTPPIAPPLHDLRREQAPLVLGRWQLVGQIAGTEHAELYRARPVHQPAQSTADYLIKVARREESAALAGALLRREKAVGQSIRHPHIAPVLGGDVSHAPPYLVLANAGSVAADSVQSSIRSALWRVRQAAAAVAALHGAGWIHSRLTPQALFVSPRGHVMLSELGWGRRIDTEECRGEHLLAADLRYVAPEMLCDRTVITPACDVYVLGLLLIELLIGRPAVNADFGWQAALAHLRGELADWRGFCADVPQAMIDLLTQMTCREPLRRPRAQEVKRGLVRLELAQLSAARASRTRWR
jgi:eukaryotic-like serine/threonine-protein kinase